MKNLIIIGAGGMGKQLWSFAHVCSGYNSEYVIKGFIDDNLHAMDGFQGYPPILGTIKDYQPEPNDVFINSIGDVQFKKKCISEIINRGGEFINLIHPLAGISLHTKIGKGNIIAARVGIGVETLIGDFNLIQDGAIIGHDVKIGNWCRIDCYAVLIAGVTLEDEVCIHTSAVINHNVTIGKGAMVGAQSFVFRNVKPGITVMGNPAKKLIV